MAKDLRVLVRLRQWEVDEQRRALGVLLRRVGELEERARAIEMELDREREAARAAPEQAGLAYPAFAARAIERRRAVAAAIARLEEEIADARDRLNDAYRALKQLELVAAARARDEATERRRREQKSLDGVAARIAARTDLPG